MHPKRDLAIVFLDTAYPPVSPSCDHGGGRNLESKGFERPGEMIIACSKKASAKTGNKILLVPDLILRRVAAHGNACGNRTALAALEQQCVHLDCFDLLGFAVCRTLYVAQRLGNGARRISCWAEWSVWSERIVSSNGRGSRQKEYVRCYVRR